MTCLIRPLSATLGVAVAFALSGTSSRADPPTPAEFAKLLEDLDDDKFPVRKMATDKLTKFAETAGDLTPAQVLQLQDRSLKGPLDGQRLAGLVFRRFVAKFPSAAAVIDNLKVRADGTTGVFTLGKATGKYDPKDADSVQSFRTLQRHWKAIALGLGRADFRQTEVGYGALFDEIKRLDDAGLKKLNLKRDGKDLTFEGFEKTAVEVVEPAILKHFDDLENAGANIDPGPRDTFRVDAAGAVPFGPSSSLGLNLKALVAGGALDISSPPPDLSLVLPPPGTEFVGDIYDIRAVDGLEVFGRVRVDIEYGPLDLLDNPAVNPASFRILRYADGVSTFLTPDPDHTDPGRFILSGYYDAPSPGSGADQFGQFVIVQTVPGPSSLVLLGVGGLALAARRGRRGDG
ncbi:MAG: hypothetical protein K2X87_05795 [Gemmataceae bacterium]|nr:hypothetical protein [Gemmataceae bacterium]